MSKTKPQTAEEVEALAVAFDLHRHCGWNDMNVLTHYGAPEFRASDVPLYASLGDQCFGNLLELALLHTLRPCKDCGGDYLYKGGYQIACCSCLGENDECEDCRDGGCRNVAINMNLRDAITRWNLHHGDTGPRGRVKIIG